jgi:hypothetical protein
VVTDWSPVPVTRHLPALLPFIITCSKCSITHLLEDAEDVSVYNLRAGARGLKHMCISENPWRHKSHRWMGNTDPQAPAWSRPLESPHHALTVHHPLVRSPSHRARPRGRALAWSPVTPQVSYPPFACACAAQYALPVVHDPTICKDGAGKYWLFGASCARCLSSSGIDPRAHAATAVGISIKTSTDRTKWTDAGVVWPNGLAATNTYTGASNACVCPGPPHPAG